MINFTIIRREREGERETHSIHAGCEQQVGQGEVSVEDVVGMKIEQSLNYLGKHTPC